MSDNKPEDKGQSDKKPTFAVSKDDAGRLAEALGQDIPVTPEPDQWLNRAELAEKLTIAPTQIQKIMGQLDELYDHEKGGVQTVTLGGQPIHLKKIETSSGKPALGVAEQDTELLKPTPEVNRGIQPKSLKPDGDHIQDRTGRSRGKTEDDA